MTLYSQNIYGENNLRGKSFTLDPQEDTINSESQVVTLSNLSSHTRHAVGNTTFTNPPTYQLPDATTLITGTRFLIINSNPNQILLKDSTLPVDNLAIITPGSRAECILFDNSTSAGDWKIIVTSQSSFQGVAPVLAVYLGNANVGRYLEIFPSADSLEFPFPIVNSSVIIAAFLGSAAATTGQIGIFKKSDLVNPVITFGLTAQTSRTFVDLNAPLSLGDEMSIRVTSGSFIKPRMAIYFSSN